jgi:phosphoglycerate kinase
LANAYVNDAFGSSHRAHASVEAITKLLPQPAAGLLMEKEVRYLGHALGAPERPFVAILGGAKVSDKIEVIENLLGKVDVLVVGGAMAYTFLKSRGLPIGRSLVEDDKLEAARKITAHAHERGVTLALPVDHVVVEKLEAGAPCETIAVDSAAIGERMGVDIGPKTVALFQGLVAGAKTVVWNGPMGVFEMPPFDTGTNALAKSVAAVKGTTIGTHFHSVVDEMVVVVGGRGELLINGEWRPVQRGAVHVCPRGIVHDTRALLEHLQFLSIFAPHPPPGGDINWVPAR